MNACVELLRRLVAIPSVNPVYGGPGENEVGAFVAEWLGERGIECSSQEALEGRMNLFARIGPDDAPAILVEAHMDTVGVDGWAMGDPFQLREADGKWYGRGACDTKASLAIFMLLAAQCQSKQSEMKRALVFAASVDEESAQTGAFKLAELKDRLGIEAALTGEPTRSSIVTRHKGACRYTLEAKGRAAHGSTPDAGENAIYKISRIVEKLERLASLLSREDGRSAIERGSLNVGRIHGGIGFNIVPDRCLVDVDRRLGVGESLPEARETIRSIAQSETDVSMSTVIERPALNTGDDNPFPQALLSSAQAAGCEARFEAAAYMTNGVAYAESGLPTVVFGPGDISQAHKVDEFIEDGEMDRSLRILETFFLS